MNDLRLRAARAGEGPALSDPWRRTFYTRGSNRALLFAPSTSTLDLALESHRATRHQGSIRSLGVAAPHRSAVFPLKRPSLGGSAMRSNNGWRRP